MISPLESSVNDAGCVIIQHKAPHTRTPNRHNRQTTTVCVSVYAAIHTTLND